MRVAACAVCKFNVDELCQHINCRTCPGQQRNSGGLAAKQRNPNEICPAGKW